MTELNVPGFELPIPIALLNCSLTFPLHLTGSWDETTGVVDVSQSEVAVPALPMLCALSIQAATQINVNDPLSQLPPGTVSIRLAIDGPPATTTTTTLAPTSSTSSTSVAPTSTLPTTSTLPATPSTTVISVKPDSNEVDPPTTLPRSGSPQAPQPAARAAQAVSGSPDSAG